MVTNQAAQGRRLAAVRRESEQVKPLELFFDLVFVLAITQCTALMVGNPTWEGIAQALLVLALLWWSWVGYTWLTSVVDPEEGLVRLAIFAAMAALLIVALSVPDVFGDHAVWFAVAYGAVRVAHIGLFLLASRDDPALRRSVGILALGVGTSVTLLLAGSLLGGAGQWVLWIAALAVDMGVPYLFGSAGWRLTPAHFAERHWLVVIIALGESVVALGVGADVGLDFGVAVAGVLGIALVCELWWIYFDVVAILGSRRLTSLAEGRERNELARDVYSYMHFLLVAGIVLAAFGLHEVLPHVDEPLEAVPAFALLGGVALYLLGHVAIRYRHTHTLSGRRLFVAVLLLALVPLGAEIASLLPLAIAVALLCVLIIVETISYGETRDRVRHPVEPETG